MLKSIKIKYPERPVVGLVLSGGGARGLAHIGVLKVLEEYNIPVDLIIGTSIGSVVGGLYAAGYSPGYLEKIALKINWEETFSDKTERENLFLIQKEGRAKHIIQVRFEGLRPYIPMAISAGQTVTNTINNLLLQAKYKPIPDFDYLKIPFRVVSTDIVSGKEIVFKSGDITEAIRSSIAIPLILSPVKKGEMMLVDGGISNILPVNIARDEGSDIVIAVDLSYGLRTRDKLKKPWEIADQIVNIMMEYPKREQIKNADVLIKPDVKGHSSADFTDIEFLISAGAEAAREKVGEIKALIDKQHSDSSGNLIINDIEVEGNRYIGEREILQRVEFSRGDTVSVYQIESALKNVFKMGSFDDVYAVIKDEGSAGDLKIMVKENPLLKGVEFHGNAVLDDSTIYRNASFNTGEPINFELVESALEQVIGFYRRNYWSLALIKSVDFDSTDGILSVYINEGIIRDVSVAGNSVTKDFVILREFPLKSGDIFNFRLSNIGINNIYSTELFDNVSLKILNVDDNLKILLSVEEKHYNSARIGLRGDRERGISGFLEINNDNLIGSGTKGTLFFKEGKRDRIYKLSIESDRFLTTYLTYRFNLYSTDKDDYLFLKDRIAGEYRDFRRGVNFSLGEQIRRLGAVTVKGEVEMVEIKAISGGIMQKDSFLITGLTFQSIVDTKNRAFFPTRGKYNRVYYKVASEQLGGDVSFIKLFGTFEQFTTYWKNHTFHPRIMLGLSDKTIPFQESFRLGGEQMLMGTRENQNVGKRLIVGNLEYRYKIPGNFIFDKYLYLRYDFGAVWKDPETPVSIEDFVHGAGFKIALDTFWGPLILGYGRCSKGYSEYYFRAGYNF